MDAVKCQSGFRICLFSRYYFNQWHFGERERKNAFPPTLAGFFAFAAICAIGKLLVFVAKNKIIGGKYFSTFFNTSCLIFRSSKPPQ